MEKHNHKQIEAGQVWIFWRWIELPWQYWQGQPEYGQVLGWTNPNRSRVQPTLFGYLWHRGRSGYR